MRPARDDLERLERELQGSAYLTLLRRLQSSYLFLRQFRTWPDAIAFMRSGNSTDPRKDEVLRPILAAHAEDQDPRWRTVLLTIFRPGLLSVHRKRRHWDEEEPDELLQRIMWAFLQTVCRVDVRRRPDRLVQKIINDTYHRLYDEYRRDWARARREVQPVPEDPEHPDSPGTLDELIADLKGIDFDGIELREVQELETKRLREHLAAGRISQPDFLLLVGTRIYGQTVADFAREAGLAYQVAKKRRQRAEAAIRRFEAKEPGGPEGAVPE